jgi:hypothetical protein
MRAASGCALTGEVRGAAGRMSAKPARRMTKAEKTPNAIAARDAQTNIARSNRFIIDDIQKNVDKPWL